MKIVNCKQQTPEWFELREKRMTASHATAIGNYGAGLKTYIDELMTAYFSSAEPDNYTSKDMHRGNELEPIAAGIYELETGISTTEVGFIIHNDYVGCSPDRFAGDEGLTEIKCPNDKNYYRLLKKFKIDPKYMWQMQMQMLVSGKKWNDYVVYNQNFEKSILIKRVFPDVESFSSLEKGFKKGEELIEEATERMCKINRGILW